MSNNKTSGCGIVVLAINVIIAGILIYVFGLKTIINFVINSILFVMIAPVILGVIYMIFWGDKK
jgi:hypothetical protein